MRKIWCRLVGHKWIPAVGYADYSFRFCTRCHTEGWIVA